MRDELCRQLVDRSADERMVFLTGDLGFMALEPLQDAMGPRFINCGVAEQNMVSVAAALSYEGLEAWTYTIAPFCYARAFEQIRNDVCLHGLAVKLLANGGGYAYGVMGPTHHALEDYGILLTLPNMTAFVPAFAEDMSQTLERAGDLSGPAYIRLGRGEKPQGEVVPAYAPWRRLLDGRVGVMIAVGPLAGSAWGVLRQFDPASRPALWAVSELPIEANPPPSELTDALSRTRRLAVVEEHVAYGGVGQAMCHWVIEAGIGLDRFRHLHASGRPGLTYGSQAFLRRGSGLDPEGNRARSENIGELTMLERGDWVRALRGPIVVLGAGGFVGANLLRQLLKYREDVFGVVRFLPAWRLEGIDRRHILEADLIDLAAARNLVTNVRPRTVFNCVAYGAYSFETDFDLIYRTNFGALVQLVELLAETDLAAFIHAGSSSEYGTKSAGPLEEESLQPNSHYSVSKAAASNYIAYAGKIRHIPMLNLRLYSVYGPLEDTSRLIPNLVAKGLKGAFPPLVDPNTSRDFIYIDDVCDAFVQAAARLTPDIYGEALNIGTGRGTTIRQLAKIAADVFAIGEEPIFGSMAGRSWDLPDWYAAPGKAEQLLNWTAKTDLTTGLKLTSEWVRSLEGLDAGATTKRGASPRRRSISAIIACYKDEPAIPIMYRRLTDTFKTLDVDYEIIFVNDGSPDNCAERIVEISATDPHVVGITHSRNFGSQMAFRSGMEMSVMQACVLLDGDLQDPPELIEQFYHQWTEGFDVIYGRRVKRDMPFIWGVLYKAFYRIFAMLSYVKIPHDAGDFSLIDRRVVNWLLRCPERDLFLRGLRAYIGFRQTGVDYVRPKRAFGESTNNLLKNLEWAKRGIFSFSNAPLKLLSAGGVVLLCLSIVMALIVIALRLWIPNIAPRGVTTLLLASLFFGAINLFAVGLVGEYIAKIMEEVKARPRLIRAELIRAGQTSRLLPDESTWR